MNGTFFDLLNSTYNVSRIDLRSTLPAIHLILFLIKIDKEYALLL